MRRVKPLLVLQALLISGIVFLGVLGLIDPKLLPEAPAANSPTAMAVLCSGLALFAILGWRALRTYLLTRRVADLLVAIGIVWLGTALVAALTMAYSDLGWWLGHMFELDGIMIVAIPVALDLAHTAQARPLAGDLNAADLVSAEEVFLGSHVRAITLRLAEKDAYTEQHTRRVALRAVQVGERLGLSRRRLRALAIGGLVHDIGKLSVPDSILKKPGPLDGPRVRGDQAPSRVGREAARRARRLPRFGPAPGARPPRATRRLGLSVRPPQRTRSGSTRASSPSAMSTTR